MAKKRLQTDNSLMIVVVVAIVAVVVLMMNTGGINLFTDGGMTAGQVGRHLTSIDTNTHWEYASQDGVRFIKPSITDEVMIFPSNTNPGNEFSGPVSMFISESLFVDDYLEVFGSLRVGSSVFSHEYCDEDGQNCFLIDDISNMEDDINNLDESIDSIENLWTLTTYENNQFITPITPAYDLGVENIYAFNYCDGTGDLGDCFPADEFISKQDVLDMLKSCESSSTFVYPPQGPGATNISGWTGDYICETHYGGGTCLVGFYGLTMPETEYYHSDGMGFIDCSETIIPSPESQTDWIEGMKFTVQYRCFSS